MEQRIEYKLALLAYRSLHGLAPPYLAKELHPVSTPDTRRRLRSATTNALVVPLARLSTVGDRALPVAAARVWNSLPVSVTSAATLNTFKQRLKTELFIRCYDLPSSYAPKHANIPIYSVILLHNSFYIFSVLSVLAAFGLNATIIILV